MEKLSYTKLNITDFNTFCIDELDDPSEILNAREIYIKNEHKEGNVQHLAQSVTDFVRDPSVWRNYFNKHFTREQFADLDPNLIDSKTCEQVCGLAAKFYGFPNPFKTEIRKSCTMSLGKWKETKEAIKMGYEILLAELIEEIGFESLDQAMALLREACKCKQPKCYLEVLKRLIPDLSDYLSFERSEEMQMKLNDILIMNAMLGVAEGMKELIVHGAHKEVKIDFVSTFRGLPNKGGYTLLHIAALYNQSEAIRELIALGVDKEARDNDNCTALHLAVKSKGAKAIWALIELGANKHALDKENKTPWDLAENKLLEKHPEIENLLKIKSQEIDEEKKDRKRLERPDSDGREEPPRKKVKLEDKGAVL